VLFILITLSFKNLIEYIFIYLFCYTYIIYKTSYLFRKLFKIIAVARTPSRRKPKAESGNGNGHGDWVK